MNRTENLDQKSKGSPLSMSTKIILLVIGGALVSLVVLAGLFTNILPRVLTRNRWIPKVATSGLVGYVDKSGAWVISPQFDQASKFSEGLAAVTVGRGYEAKVGYIDSTGNYVIYPQFDFGEDFKNGRAWVGSDLHDGWRNARWGYIDKHGNVIRFGSE